MTYRLKTDQWEQHGLQAADIEEAARRSGWCVENGDVVFDDRHSMDEFIDCLQLLTSDVGSVQ